jgi:hypothetical protein
MPDMEIGRGPEYLASYPTTLFRGSFVPITELSTMIENGKVLLFVFDFTNDDSGLV